MILHNLERHLWVVFYICHLNAFELSNKYESLTRIYDTYNEGPGFDHYYEYGPAYDENIHQIREEAVHQGKKVKVLEIGIQSGGSTRVWKRYFRGTLDYTGIDIDKRCKQFESLKEGIKVEIGSQLDTNFLKRICATHGPFDLVIDDGGHTNDMMWTSLSSLWSCLNDKAVYVIEDIHALNMGRFLREGDVPITKKLGDWMKVRSPPTNIDGGKFPKDVPKDHPGYHLQKMSFYDSLLFLVYEKDIQLMKRLRKGSHWAPDVHKRGPRISPRKELIRHCFGCCIGCYDD